MRFSVEVDLPFPRPRVFETCRDALPALVARLPDVRSIEVRSRVERGPQIEIVNHWRGGGEIPAVARAFLSEAMLCWTDFTLWDGRDFTCRWRVESGAFREAIRSEGVDLFTERGAGTHLETQAELSIDPTRLRGVPTFLARRALPSIEQHLRTKAIANLLALAQALRRHLEEH